MKAILLLTFSLIYFQCLFSQQPKPELKPVKWIWAAKIINDTEWEARFEAKIDEGWTVYSQFLESEDGPVATSFSFENAESKDKAVETTSKSENKKQEFDKTFEMVLTKYKKNLVIVHKLKVKSGTKEIKGYVTFMTCNAEECLPPRDIDFILIPTEINVKIDSQLVKIDTQITVKVDTQIAKIDTQITNLGLTTANINGQLNTEITRPVLVSSLAEIAKKGGDCGIESNAVGLNKQSWLMIFIFGFLGGLLALLTPCVFPMVPLTVSYFTKRGKAGKAGIINSLIYGAAIIVIYVALGLGLTLAFGADILNWVSTHWIPNTLFFFLFVVFAISFFGYYDIKLPATWTTATENASDKGGLLGIFFMAFTLALVSFSCTGPIIGTLLVEAADGGLLGPTAGMLGFSLALALPFGLFAMFPSWLNSLPKGGGWMTAMKVVLGFIELALAFKFLSKADLTEHWGVLKYETYLSATIACTLGIGIYLLGLITFPHDEPNAPISKNRRWFALTWLVLAAYFATGFFINPKTKTYNTPFLLSGIAPPACYSYFHPCGCPAGINECFKDYYEGIAYAKKVNKPAMIDFTGHGCENCRKMEDQVWVDDKVNKLLNEEFVLISLYVDDRKPLDSIRTKTDGSKLRTVGSLWAEFENVNFGQQTQPLYVLISPNEQVLHSPVEAIFDKEKYAEFLKCGLSRYKETR
jgi:thiol:disulfide interchange protein